MNACVTFYNEQLAINKATLAKIKQQLFVSSMLRLFLFVITAVVVYVVFTNIKLVLGAALVAVALFLFLVSRHTDLQYKRDQLKALIELNKTELLVLERKFHQLPAGEEFKDGTHYFSQDIDLFGVGSFFQYCNRTALPQGREFLASVFMSNTTTAIPEKQEAVKELAAMPVWRQQFTAVASLVKTETTYSTILKWLGGYVAFMSRIKSWMVNLFSFLSLGVLIAGFIEIIPLAIVGVWICLGLLITAKFTKKITQLAVHTSKIQNTFQQYQQLVLQVEATHFKAPLLQEQQKKLISTDVKVSAVLKEFSGILSALDQRNNILMAFLGNALVLWDIRQVMKLEKWIYRHKDEVAQWFSTIAFFDAYNSLGNFSFNHPNYAFPKITQNECVLKATQVAHPLLDPRKSVANDITIDKAQFFIITGANMAGKSTFLRTVSLQLVMANVGLPVCATEASYTPIKLITSMRTTDSLTDDESYFYSELKRLKYIVDRIGEESYFIVLDEILKGTNSTDKAIGSRKFVEKLVGSYSTGIIATHDLSLCEVAEELPQVKNYYFDAEITEGELHFDYQFKKGICQNMNASFLLKKMNIV